MNTGASKKIKKYLNVEKNKIFTKVPARIVLNVNEYKDFNEVYGEEVGIAEIENVLELPGFFTLEFPEEGDSIDFFFPYNIYLNIANGYDKSKEEIIINFDKDEMILYANFRTEETDIRILKSLFENGVKYLGDKPDKLLIAIWQQLLPNSNVPWWHLEVLVSQLYGTYDKKTKEILPLRLTNLPYSKKYILNLKQSAHMMNTTLPVMYGYTKDALRTMVSKKKRGTNSFFENIMAGNYDEMTKDALEARKQKPGQE